MSLKSMPLVSGGQRLLDEVQPVLAEEHLVADEEGGRAERAARHRLPGIGDQLLLDRRLLRSGEERVCVETRGDENVAQHTEVARVLLLDPHRREHGVGIGLEVSVALGGEAATHEAERHDREERVALVGHAVAPGEARQVHSVVGGLGGHIARRRIAGLLEHAAQKHRLPGDLRARALCDAGHLRVGEIGGRRTDIEPEFKAFRHGATPSPRRLPDYRAQSNSLGRVSRPPVRSSTTAQATSSSPLQPPCQHFMPATSQQSGPRPPLIKLLALRSPTLYIAVTSVYKVGG